MPREIVITTNDDYTSIEGFNLFPVIALYIIVIILIIVFY